jgi:hypothetical protein
LLEICAACFEALARSLGVALAVCSIAALLLIALCCWQTLREAPQRNAPAPPRPFAAYGAVAAGLTPRGRGVNHLAHLLYWRASRPR